jgi:hypothetical protein
MDQRQGPEHETGLEPDQVHPAPQQRLFWDNAAVHNRHKSLLVVLHPSVTDRWLCAGKTG